MGWSRSPEVFDIVFGRAEPFELWAFDPLDFEWVTRPTHRVWELGMGASPGPVFPTPAPSPGPGARPGSWALGGGGEAGNGG